MKKLLSLAILLFIVGNLSAQQDNYQVIRESRVGCLPDGIEFQSQAEVDNFAINYPDCNTILGNVIVQGEDITNMNALININRIEGELVFFTMDYYNFTSSGLDSLHYTGGLLFDWNDIVNLDGLHNLDTINGNLGFSLCDFNEPLSGLGNLKHIGGNLGLQWTYGLTSLQGLENLHSIGGSLILADNNSLSDISALSNLQTVGGYISAYGNQFLTSLAALNNVSVSQILGLAIYNNESLSYCNEPFICEYLSNPTGPVNIYSNAPGCNGPGEIADSCGFTLSCLPYGNYYLTSQAAVDNFSSDYNGCAVLNGYLKVSGDDITNLSGLTGISAVHGSVNIGSTSIQDFTGLDSLKIITGALTIGSWYGDYNPFLANFNGLGNLEVIGGAFYISDNPVLHDFSGLDRLKSIGEFDVLDNAGLMSFDGLNQLDSVMSHLYIYNNPVTDLKGFEHLKYVGDIMIIANNQLTTLSGLDSVQPTTLQISGNAQLSECDIESICNFLSIPGSDASISNNATGCNSREEVEEECITGVNDISPERNLIIYPNPAKDFIVVKMPGNSTEKTITVYNPSGKVLLNKGVNGSDSVIDVSNFPDGFYIVGFPDNNQWAKFQKISHD